MENPIKMDDLGGKPTIFGNTQIAGNNDKLVYQDPSLIRMECLNLLIFI